MLRFGIGFVVLFVNFFVVSARAEFTIAPLYEGVYSVDLSCTRVDDSHCRSMEGKYNLVVMNTVGNRGTTVSFHKTKINVTYYEFTVGRFENQGAVIEGWESIGKSERNGEFHLEIDSNLGIVGGWLQDNSLLSELVIRGEVVTSPGPLYSRDVLTPTVSVNDLIGVYSGGVPSTRGELILRRRRLGSENELTAGWMSSHAGYRFDFDFVEYLPERGVINLVEYRDTGVIKWTLSVSRDAGPVQLGGIMFSTVTGLSGQLSLSYSSGL